MVQYELPVGKWQGTENELMFYSNVSGCKYFYGVTTNAADGNVTMPPHNFINDAHLAEVASCVRMNFASRAEAVTPQMLKRYTKL